MKGPTVNIYIAEDDLSVINNLEEIIEQDGLGIVCGDSGEESPNVAEILALNPDLVLLDFLMPDKDGIQLVRELREAGCTAKCVMISQISSKELIGKAYNAGIDFFISKPINVIEVRSVIRNVAQQRQNEQTLANIQRMFANQVSASPPEMPDEQALVRRKIEGVLNQLGMSGEKGCEDIVRVCLYMREKRMPMSASNIGQICEQLSDSPKNMEQRIRRAIAQGMCNLAHLGLEDFMSETFVRYSGSLFSFEEIKAEMDFVRGKRGRGGKINIKKYIQGLLVIMNED